MYPLLSLLWKDLFKCAGEKHKLTSELAIMACSGELIRNTIRKRPFNYNIL